MKTRRLTVWLVIFTITAFLPAWRAAGAESSPALTRPATLSLTRQEPEFLAVDDAFRLTVRREGDQLHLAWQIADGYYLYQHRFQIKPQLNNADLLAPLDFPPGVARQDEVFGPITAYYGEVELTVVLPPRVTAEDAGDILVTYQGCADAGLCYPPRKRTIRLIEDGGVTIHGSISGH